MLKPKSLGLSGGIIWGVSMFVCTLLSLWTGYGSEFYRVLGSVYPGYEISLVGSVIGAAYGFFDAFIGFWLLAWLYNKFS